MRGNWTVRVIAYKERGVKFDPLLFEQCEGDMC